VQIENNLDCLPAELRALPNWVVWKLEARGKDGRATKVPYCPATHRKAKANDSSTWGSFDQALEAVQAGNYNGLGFQLGHGLFGIDIDHCINPETGEVGPQALRIVEALPSYVERSPSGTGLHIICKGELPTEMGRGRRKEQFEVYGRGRYFTVTGDVFGELRPVAECSEELKALWPVMFPDEKPVQGAAGQAPRKPSRPRSHVDALPHEILAKMFASRNGERIKALYEGRWEQYASSQSEADLALCNSLAWWFNGDVTGMDEAFRLSALMRDKWDEKRGAQSYGEITIQKAINGLQGEGYDPHGQRAAQRHLEAHVAFAEVEEAALEGNTEARNAFEHYAAIYEKATDLYMSRHGATYIVDGNSSKQLASFTAVIKKEITVDDGAEPKKDYLLEGVSERGKPLPAARVAAKSFAGMGWLAEKWGVAASLMPGSTVKDKLRHAIEQTGRGAEQQTIYTHTGWRKIGGRWAYLHNEGAIDAEGVSVELADKLAMYALAPSPIAPVNAACESFGLLEAFPLRISVPLLALQYLAPLCEFMGQNPPAFTLFLAGSTGSGKSTIASLFLSHFGKRFGSLTAPASFGDTANSLGYYAFLVKYAPLLVDDYHPVSSLNEKRIMQSKAQALARSYGDRAGRGRLRADASLQSSKPARGLCIVTGEDTPDIGESGFARYYRVDMRPEDVLSNEAARAALTALQDRAAEGAFSQAMRGYIEWLAGQADELPMALAMRFKRFRGEARARLPQAHGRLVDAVAHLALGLRMALAYFMSQGLIDETEAHKRFGEGLQALTENVEGQIHDMRSEEPTKLFFDCLRELLATGEAVIQSLMPPEPSFPYNLPSARPPEGLCGYADATFTYLLPGSAFAAVSEQLRKQGRIFPIGKGGLGKRLKELGLVQTGSDGAPSRQKFIRGANLRVWCVPNSAIKLEREIE
jgi:primase-polymerase (primpol)-like protein